MEIKTVIFIDYENIQHIDFGTINENDTKIFIFLGNNQYKIPIETVEKTQAFGKMIEWIKIEQQGKNALDFLIAYYLGKLNHEIKKETKFIITSKDKGFDSLISFLNNKGRKILRIDNLEELQTFSDNFLEKI